MHHDNCYEPVKSSTSSDELGKLYRACLEPQPPKQKRIYPDWFRPVGESQITRQDEAWSKAGHELH